MKKLCFFFTIFLFQYTYSQHSSTNNLNFDGVNDYVQIPHNTAFNPGKYFTVEAWIKADSWASNSWGGTIISKDQWTSISEGWVLRCGNGGRLSFNLALNNNGNWYEIVTSSSVMTTNNWYHVAGTYDGSIMRLYLNGKQVGTLSQSGTITASNAPINIGNIAMSGQSRFFDGEIDEVRIWDTVLTESAIRQYMCHRMDGSHPFINNLTAHYTLDAGTGTTVYDGGPNSFNGTNFGAIWGLSGVPLGDGSDYLYPSSWTGTDFTFGHANGDSLTVSNVTGSPQGIQVYYIDSQPNILNPPPGVASFYPDRFYGVFTTSGSNVTFKTTLNYDGYPGITNQGKLNLNYRSHNADTTWDNLNITLDTIAKTMIRNSTSKGEFALGKNDELSPFDLHSPLTNSSLILQGAVNLTGNFDWFSSKTKQGGQASYKWILDYDTADFSSPLGVKNSNSSGKDTIVGINFLYLANIMNQENLYYGDTLHAKWSVEAVAGPVYAFANQSHSIDIVRNILDNDVIYSFGIDMPDNDTLEVFNGGLATSLFNWDRTTSSAGDEIEYKVQFASEFGSLSNPITGFGADNNGLDTVANISDADLALMLKNIPYPNGQIFKFKWRVRAEIGNGMLTSFSNDSNYVYIIRNDDPYEGIEDFLNVDWNTFPNPVNNKVHINVKRSISTDYYIEVLNIEGKSVIDKSPIESDHFVLKIPESIVNGLYLVRISDNSKYSSKRIVVQK